MGITIEPTLRGSLIFINYWYQKQVIRGAEVGVFNGIHATTMLSFMKNLDHLYLVDPYEGAFSKSKENGAKSVSSFGERISWIYKRFRHCTLTDIPEPLDFAYIDGEHSYSEVRIDLKQATKFVKPFGVICGHDFQMKGVKQAVEEYCRDHSKQLRTWGGEWWFINGDLNKEQREKFIAFVNNVV